MDLLGLILLIIVVAVVLWVINFLLEIPQSLRTLINVVVAVLLLVFLAYVLLGSGGIRLR